MMSETESLTASAGLEHVPMWPNFVTTGDKVSGRVPVTRLQSWRSLQEVFESPFFNRAKTHLIFRGSRRYDWSLTPTLGRLHERRIITRDVANAQLRLFRRAVRGRTSDRNLVDDNEEYELWSVGQHHGLHTPLLDWTHSPYVALFFAFEREDPRDETDNPYRAIYVLNKSYVEAEDRCPGVNVVEPRKDDHGRLVNQAGLFTYSAYDRTLEDSLIESLQGEVLEDVEEHEEANVLSEYLCKIYIPNEDRVDCLRHLRLMNVHHASLFPDLLGAASYCNVLVAEQAQLLREAELSEPKSPAPSVALRTSDAATGFEAPSQLVAQVRQILQQPAESSQVEAPRQELLAHELAAELTKNQYVDWEKRESLQAAIRNATKVVLRKFGYPESAREEVLEQLIDALRKQLVVPQSEKSAE